MAIAPLAEPGMHPTIQSAYGAVHRVYDGPVRVAVEWISPADARAMLLRNESNRALKPSLISAIKADIGLDCFYLNGETIKVAASGRLLDGQNRLTAIVETDTGQWCVVVRDLDEASADSVDIGAKRSLGDTLSRHGEAAGNTLASAVRLSWLIETNGHIWTGASYPYPSHAQMQDWLARNAGIRDSLAVGDRLRRSLLRYPPSPAAALHYLMSKRDAGQADTFWNLLASGVDLDDGNPILTLRSYLIRELTSGGTSRINVTPRLAVTIKAWNAHRAGKTLRVIKWTRSGDKAEDFPVIR